MPEHVLRIPQKPARRRPRGLFDLFRLYRSNRKTRTVRRGKMLIATCAIAGAATLGACSPAQEGQGNHAVNIAHAYLGVPYVYGGASPAGFDCSGLTSYVYAQLGKFLPRSAEAQFEAVQKIPQSWVQKGDLIFFGTPGAIYHVGIYVGNGMIEHAPVPGQVVSIIPIWTSQYYVGRVG